MTLRDQNAESRGNGRHCGQGYEIIARQDGAFEIEVTLPGVTEPTTILAFLAKVDAQTLECQAPGRR